MATRPTERRLAAIMFTDIVGYTALMAESEERGTPRSRAAPRSVVRPLVEQSTTARDRARTGDETLSSFPSALDAVNCALAIKAELEGDPSCGCEIGIHLGDVTCRTKAERLGDGVNIAARISPAGGAGGICISGRRASRDAEPGSRVGRRSASRSSRTWADPVSLCTRSAGDAAAPPPCGRALAPAARRSGLCRRCRPSWPLGRHSAPRGWWGLTQRRPS